MLKKVYQHPLFQEIDLQLILDAHQEVHFSKGAFLLKEGETLQAYYIVEEGLTRAFVYDYEQHPITTEFSCPGEVAIEVMSLFLRVPSKENIQCLTDCKLWKIDYPDFQQLFHSSAAIAEWGRAWMSQALAMSKKRMLDMYTESAKQRYLNLLAEKPLVIQQAPLKFIASYLGITDTSLSRIRREIAIGQFS